MDRRQFVAGLLASALPLTANATASCAATEWSEWASASARLISKEGRVIDRSDPRVITTSEGQSYALFMALVDNDRALFRSLLQWTIKHLARGDLSSHLPAWIWGRQTDGRWGVLDDNSASDSDLWIAFCLLEAGRLWRLHEYTSLGTRLLQIIAKQSAIDIPGLGYQLLPAPRGFVKPGRWRLNPSYLPPQLLARAKQAQPNGVWNKIHDNSLDLLKRVAPRGAAPDWADWTGSQFDTTAALCGWGSYDAIRVYLWVGMMADDAPGAKVLKNHYRTIARLIRPDGQFPEKIDILTLSSQNKAPIGFIAALQPLLIEHEKAGILEQSIKDSITSELGYYNQMLMLFGRGWMEGRYRFNASGQLQTPWSPCN